MLTLRTLLLASVAILAVLADTVTPGVSKLTGPVLIGLSTFAFLTVIVGFGVWMLAGIQTNDMLGVSHEYRNVGKKNTD